MLTFNPQGNYVGMTEPAMDSCDPDELEAKIAKARRILRDSGNLLKKGSDHIAPDLGDPSRFLRST